MRYGLLGSVAALAASAGLAFGQGPGRPAGPAASEVITPIYAPGPGTGPGMAPAGPVAPGLTEPVPLPTAPSGPVGGPMMYGPTDLMGGPPVGYGEGFGPGGPEAGGGCIRPYVQFDYLLYFMQNMSSKYPLVSAGTTLSNGTTPNTGTTLLFGADNFEFNPFSGARVVFGLPIKCCPGWGFEMGTLILEHRQDSFSLSAEDQTLSRPVIDANTDTPSALIIARPNFATGTVTAAAETQFWTLESNITKSLWDGPKVKVRGLVGFRYADLNEAIFVNQSSFFLPGTSSFFYGSLVSPSRVDVLDQFQARNQFIGGQVGLHAECCYNRWRLALDEKLALGDMHQTSQIFGTSTIFLTPTSAPNTVPGGLLALSSNIGKHRNDRVSVLNEGNLQIGYKVSRCMEFTIGYSYMVIGNVSRPGDQIDPVINPTFLPTSLSYSSTFGPNRPMVLFPQTSFWVQGVNFGINLSF